MSHARLHAPVPGSVLADLTALLSDHLRMDPQELDPHRPFLELGADSVVFVEIVHWIEQRFGLRIAPHQLFEELVDLGSLASYIERNASPVPVVPPEPARVPLQAAPPREADLEEPRVASRAVPRGGAVEALIHQQLELMTAQLRLLTSLDAAPAVPATPRVTSTPPAPRRTAGPSEAIGAPSLRLGEAQRRYLRDFTARYNQRTASSKAQAQRHRATLVDRRAAAGFAPETKELLYPIVGAGAEGSRLRDIDGNEYIDVCMGFGVHLFGHRADFIHRALTEQLEAGVQIGPQSARVGDLAEAIARVTGMARVVFCNSGTEAVMTAIRVARAVTRRNRIAIFKGSYHGHADATLALGRERDGRLESMPMVPGVPRGVSDDVVVLEYGDDRSLEWLRTQGTTLAAVLVEPVQSRRPELQPGAFLHELRALTRETGTLLVFDEVITGFRLGLAGAQGRFGVEADLATYGKLLGGGMPIGVVAGRSDHLDCIDGGPWSFGDDSEPAAETTFFAGTFSKHPLAVAAALAVLERLEADHDAIYRELEARAARLADGLDGVFDACGVPLRTTRCASIFRLAYGSEPSRVSYLYEPLELRLFYHHMIDHGVYFWEGRTGFLSTAHSDADVEAIVRAAERSIEQLRSAGLLSGARSPTRPASQRPSSAPLSRAQEGVWLQSQLEHGTGTFNLPGGVRIRGALDPALVERAVSDLARRHDVLRARFELVDGEPRQVIVPAEALDSKVRRIDGRGSDGQAQSDWLRAFVDEEARRPFDLSTGPLLRVALIQLDEQEWVLLLTMHHLIGDGWSLGVFVRDFSALYSAARHGRPPALPDLPRQYTDHAIAQRQGGEAETLARQLEYWTTQLADAPTTLALRTDHPRPRGTFRSTTLARVLEPAVLEPIREAACRAQATLHMTLLSAFATLLHRHTGQDDMLIGIPVITRDRADLRDLIGLFINTLTLRVRVDEGQSFFDLLHQVRRTALEAYANQDVPFHEVVKAVAPERSADRHPLFQVWFNFDMDRETTALHLEDLDVEPLEEQVDTPTKLDLSLHVQQQGQALILKWIYNERAFERDSIVNLAEQFEHLLAQLAAEPEHPLSRASLMTPRATALLADPSAELFAGNPRPVCDTIARRASHAPDAIAVSRGERAWSYRELQDAATTLAERLEVLGAPGSTLAVTGRPSFGLIVSIVAVLGSDRVLLLVDPSLPPHRKTVMLREAGAHTIITVGEGNEDGVAAGLDVIDVDPETAKWDGSAVTGMPGELSSARSADADGGPAYVFFTSGTTGTPKGVLGTHAGLAHFVEWQRQRFLVGPGDRVAQATRSSFDAILRDIFLPLTSGATLCLPEPDDMLEPAATLRWLERAKISVLHAVPTLGALWSGAATEQQRLPELRLLFFAGEPLKSELVEAWQALAPEAQIVNFYGPTETTMIKTYYCVPREPHPGVQPVGRPLPHGQSLVLGRERRLCGIGEIGEIVLRTPYRTRGYINAPSEQVRRFIVNPFGCRSDDLLYRTGDLGRIRADGQLEVLGRLDRQIKLRGVRIELGELESMLASHAKVAQASVQIVDDDRGARLLAFVVGRGASPSSEDLVAFLHERLPAAMMPSRVLVVERLPLLANGKVDGRALVAQVREASTTQPVVAPRTPTEQLVASYVAELLELEQVGIHDDFFELGGHSLLAAQLVARLRRALGVPLSLRTMFESPTVAGVSAHIDAQEGVRARSLALTLQHQRPDDGVLEETLEL